MLESLVQFDRQLLLIANVVLTNSILDLLMPLITSDWLWGAVIIAWFGYAIRSNNKSLLKILIVMLVCMAVADYFAYNGLKPYFGRLRPCKELFWVRTLPITGCGGWQSFPSNHATNGMVIAVFATKYFISRNPKVVWVIFLLLSLVGYSRSYLGAHYPLDVLAGYVTGLLIGGLGLILMRWIKFLP
jgi:undecaprenyl-diphosphatase